MSFYRFPVGLFKASGFVNASTGEVIELTPAMKMIYVHLFTRFHFFTGKLKSEMYESQKAIADACNVNERTVQRAMKAFVDAGVVVSRVNRFSGKSRTTYEKVNQLVLVMADTEKGVDNSEIPDSMGDIDYTDEFLAGIQWE